jgi:hypothetical protein
MAALAGAQGQSERAARLLGAASAHDAALRTAHRRTIKHADAERCSAGVRASLGEAAFALVWEAGRALPLEQAIADALALPAED